MRLIWFRRVLTLATLVAVCAGMAAAADPQAASLVRQALAAQGGEATLRALRSVQLDATGYRDLVEQSERPEGPYVVEFDHLKEVHDLAGQRLRRSLSAQIPPFPEFTDTLVLAGDVAMRGPAGHNFPAGNLERDAAAEALALSPERLLLTALEAPSLRAEPDTVLRHIVQHVVVFDLDGSPVRIYLNRHTLLPTAVDYSGPAAHAGYWNYLGDVTLRTWYTFWSLQKGGIHYPLQWNTERNGLPDRVLMITSLILDGALDEALLTIPPEVRAQAPSRAGSSDLEALPLGLPDQPTVEVAPGVVFIPGRWNVTLVRQGDGVVVLEAPISSGYSAKVIEEAGRRFPGAAIKAVITTSDAWPHLAGIREYVARGVPVYALDLDRPILERVIGDRRQSKPDRLARAPRPPVFHIVSTGTALGSGPNRLEIIPLRGATTERQMMVYFPEQRLLYGSDAFQKDSDGTYFLPQTVSEEVAAVVREHLVVERFFMMHVAPTPWSELQGVLDKATGRK
ncbi:MAG TPA: MBL fold metallo-hydrolase [Terriglobales bacterium]|nr:MBL fold metallo-hydrolase [Terriglobales bacterium]